MKPKFFSLILLFITFNSFSQSLETLKSATQKLYEANYLMDFEGISKMSYPKMVENIGEATFLEKTELHYENETYRLRYQLQSVPLQFGPIKKLNGKSFCVITIRIPKRYFFEAQLTSEEATAKKIELQEVNNTKDVTFEPNRNSFNFKKISTYVAVFDESTIGEWKFFNFDNPEQLAAFQSIFDENVKSALGLNK